MTIGTNQYGGTTGPDGIILEAGATMRWSSDYSVAYGGFIICGTPVSPPPFPAIPPFAPLPENAEIVNNLPRLEGTFGIAPVSAVQAIAAPAAFATALTTLANCSTSTWCTVHTEAITDVNGTVEGVLGRIDINNIERTASCPPPPPKPPGAIEMLGNYTPTGCAYRTGADYETNEQRATAIYHALVGANAQGSLERAAAMANITWPYTLTAPPVLTARLIDAALVLPPSPPPSPSAPPPPPSPPSPPSPPPGICSDTCDDGVPDGVCEDGGPGSEYSSCAFGTDCTDCNVRIFCTSCPQACQDFNNGLPTTQQHRACLDSEYGGDVCTPNCNSLACAYDNGVCTASQIQARCEDQSIPENVLRRPYDTPPPDSIGPNGVPVALLLDIEPMRLIIHDEYDEMFVVAEIFYQLQWQDQRLFTHPCSGALPEMLSFNKEAGRSDNARFAKDQLLQRFWTLRIDGTSLVPGYDVFDESAIVQTDRNTSWVAGFAPEGASATCEYCVTREAEVELHVVQPRFDFYYYPFDTQILKATVLVEGTHPNEVNLYTCESDQYNEENPFPSLRLMYPFNSKLDMERKLLPFTKQWLLGRNTSQSITMRHPIVNGVKRYDMCEIDIRIARSSTVYFVKYMITNIVVVFGSLFSSAYLHPEDNIGDRFAVLFIAFLIIVVAMQGDLGLGQVSQLLWVDTFNIVQIFLIAIAMFESVIVHYLLKTQRDREAISIDRVMRFVIPCVCYPIITFGTILLGIEQATMCPDTDICGLGSSTEEFRDRENLTGRMRMDNVAALVIALGLTLTAIISVIAIWWRMRKLEGEMVNSVMDLVALALRNTTEEMRPGEENMGREEIEHRRQKEWAKATERVFDVYDLDDGGSIDSKELRGVLTKMYPAALLACGRRS